MKPNILFVLPDNLPASLIGSYGNEEVKTPNLDQLAEEGVRFTNSFCASGMCSPSRATILTGLMPSQHGLHNWLNDRLADEWPKDWSAIREFRTLPVTLKNRGYQTAMIGKWHLGKHRQPGPGHDYWLTSSQNFNLDYWKNTIIENGKEYALEDKHIVDFQTEKAVEYIQNFDGKKPFFLQLNFSGPQLLPPTCLGPAKNRFYKEYVGREFKSFPRTPANWNLLQQIDGPYVARPQREEEFKRRLKYLCIHMHNDPESMANVASQVSVVDDGVGRVLTALKEKGLDENTLVIFSTDHGNLYGQHGLWGQTASTTPSNLYDTAMNVPLIMKHPGTITQGKVSDLMIGLYDLFPTLLDYVGFRDIEIENSPGKSFMACLKGNKIDNWGEEVYFEQEETRGIRTSAYCYWKRLKGTGEPEFYDMEKDPGQDHNGFGQRDYADVVHELDLKLSDFFETYSDPKFDLWRGGTAKGSVLRPELFKRIWGEGWETTTETMPDFADSE